MGRWNCVCQAAPRPLRLLCVLCDYSSKVGTRRAQRQSLYVLPAKAGIQGHRHQIHLPPWTPDQVRGDEIPANTHPHPEERSVSKGEAQCLQPLLRDGATRLLRMRMGRWNCVCQPLCALCVFSPPFAVNLKKCGRAHTLGSSAQAGGSRPG